MADITKKFDDFKNKKVKEFEKDKTYEPLSDDVIAVSKLDSGEYEKIEGPVSISQVTGIVTDEDEIK